ncbi:hypothetical protein M407DRAFT_25597 [Tulasnella calospora MUT 4182]|uniref:NYN domain-containing protein n=1 Tax=Tulasnella calospora MUT 4182 TaxID=1051891 RepID=A0A0C3Q6N3_9AGAM|nr:hypothetical protein M407DRAFT_25597 [Tulasnella calospora MUT 4182]
MDSYSGHFDDGTFNFARPAMPRGKVVIVWDYENCPVPNGMSGFTAVRMIRKAALRFGTVDHFEAYSYWSNNCNSLIKQELSVSGVKLRDCPHNGKKDVVDKTIIIDMIFYAIDRPLTTTVLLISGDRDYSYAISTLHNRGYCVKLLAPAGCLHSNMPLLADVLDWDIVLNRTSRKPEVAEIGVSTVEPTPAVRPEVPPEGSEPGTEDNQDAEEDTDRKPKVTWDSVAGSTKPNAPSGYDLDFPPLPSVPQADWAASPSPSSVTPPQSNTSDHTYSAPTISPLFEDLVAELEYLKLVGYPKPLWGMVSEGLIGRDPNILARAGVARFKQYMELAQTCGVVQLTLVPSGRETVELKLRR